MRDTFDLTGRVALVTGGAGLLSARNTEAIAEMGGVPVLLDVDGDGAEARAQEVAAAFGGEATGLAADVTRPDEVEDALARVLDAHGRVDILINNPT